MQNKYGAVGPIAIDQHGNLAVNTSTGGLVSKHLGRVGDSCTVVAENYTSSNTCTSTIGQGEYLYALINSIRHRNFNKI